MSYIPSGQFNFNQPSYVPSLLFNLGNGSYPVHRYLSASFCINQDDASLFASQVQAVNSKPLNKAIGVLSLSNCSAILFHSIYGESIKLSSASSQWSVFFNESALIFYDFQVPSGLLSFKSESSTFYTDDAVYLSSYYVAGFDKLEFIRKDNIFPVDDSGQHVHYFYHPVYQEPFSGYVPSFGFNIGGGNYAPIQQYSWPGSSKIDYLINSQRGGIRADFNSSVQISSNVYKKQCSTLEDAVRPSVGRSQWIDVPRDPPVQPSGHVTYNVLVKTSYFMQHTSSVTLLDLTPVQFESVNISIDANSFSYSFTGQLSSKDDLPKVKQPPNQPPVTLVVTINGEIWHVIVERIDHSREFGRRTINIVGRGLTALLGLPYMQPASITQGSLLAINQIAALLLPNDWSLDWQFPVWNVAAGAYSYVNQTPIQALSSIVNDIGAMIVPAKASKAIVVKPRYPVLPWFFGSVNPDISIPDSVILSLTERSFVPTQANAVYVHGGEVGGVLARCRLSGSAGDRIMQTVNNQLITDVVAARALGERLLAGQYQQPSVQSFVVPFDGDDVVLIELGWLASIIVDGQDVRGCVNSVSISAALGEVRQVIQIGDETPNTWSFFKSLLPSDPLLVGQLASTDGITSLVSLFDGGVVRVRGTGVVGNKYYIRLGKIDGQAPNLSLNEIVI